MNILRVKKIKSILIYYDIFKVTFTHAHIGAHRSTVRGGDRCTCAQGWEGGERRGLKRLIHGLPLYSNTSNVLPVTSRKNSKHVLVTIRRVSQRICAELVWRTVQTRHAFLNIANLCALIGYSSLRYPVLVHIRPVNIAFRALWLATQAWDIRHYPLVCKAQWTRARVITIHFLSLAIHWFGTNTIIHLHFGEWLSVIIGLT